MTFEIALSQEHYALISNEDADLLRYHWHATGSTHKYAKRLALKNDPPFHAYFLLHRVIVERMIGRELLDSEVVDHINNDTMDNRRCNLRVATRRQNSINRNISNYSKSGLKGVTKTSRRRWWAQIKIDGAQTSLGYFDSVLDAHRAYCQAAVKHHGEFANFGANSPFKPEDFKANGATSN